LIRKTNKVDEEFGRKDVKQKTKLVGAVKFKFKFKK
jgi:hypothetical protein